VKGITINGVTYEGVAEFIYYGTLISNDNSVEKEIQKRISADNRTYFAAISLFRSRFYPGLPKFYNKTGSVTWCRNMDNDKER